jgi:archaellum biogenesis ATPase FlaH
METTVRSAANGFSIDEWLRSSGLDVIKGPEPYDGGRKWTLRTCVFNPEHEKPVIIELSCGALCYKCLHNSCTENDWKALRRLIDPRYSDQARAPGAGTAPHTSGNHDGYAPQITDLSQIPSVFDLDAKLEWCVEEMIAQGSVTLISAESGTGKTWLAYYIAACVARGVPVIGRRVKQSDVLYLDGENPLYLVKSRLADLSVTPIAALKIWGGWNRCPPPQPVDPLVIDFARRKKGLIIFDSLIEFHTGSEQSSTETRAFMRQLRALANLGATVIVLHNSGKAETARLYRGSSDIKAAVDTAYQLTAADSQSEKLGKLHLSCFKGRLVPGQSFGFEFREGQGFVSCDPPRVRSVNEIISEILEACPKSNQSQIVTKARAMGCTKRQVEEALKKGPWTRAMGPNNSTLYDLPSDDLD